MTKGEHISLFTHHKLDENNNTPYRVILTSLILPKVFLAPMPWTSKTFGNYTWEKFDGIDKVQIFFLVKRKNLPKYTASEKN
jgi:hypothetical protein